jgi:hypothetical protein
MGRRAHRDLNIRGTVYATVADAATALGVTQEAVRIAARRGTLHRVGTGAVGAEPCPVRIRGVTYASAREAAEAFNVTPGAIFHALTRGQVDKIGLPQRYGRSRARPFLIAGMSWPSMSEADRALGFRPGYIAHTLKLNRASAREAIIAAAMALALRGEARVTAAAR